jgi:hypothetical protein
MIKTESVQQRLNALETWRESNPLRLWREAQIDAEGKPMSMRLAAPLIGTNFNSVQDWEQGQYLPSPESMRKLVEATGILDLPSRWDEWWRAKPA